MTLLELFYDNNFHHDSRSQIKIKTEILDEIENFSADDELDIVQRVKNEPSEEVSCHENSERSPESDCQRNASVSLSRRQMDGYTDLKEYIVALTRGKLLMCSVCRIEFPNEAEFRTHTIVHNHGKYFQYNGQFPRYDAQRMSYLDVLRCLSQQLTT
jgi:hypothetical protein